jgi:hypothetical protein
MPKTPAEAVESSGRRARRLADEMVRALREQFPQASIRFSQLNTGGADGVLIIRAPEAEQAAIEAAAGTLVLRAQASDDVRIEVRVERPRGERRERHQGDTFRGDIGASLRSTGQQGTKGKHLPRKTAP